MRVWTTKVVLSHPQTSQELFQFRAQNNTEKQPQRFSHATIKWTCWSQCEAWKSTGKKGASSIFVSRHTVHPPAHNDIIGHWSYLMDPGLMVLGLGEHHRHPVSLPSAQLGWVIGWGWGGAHCWAECGNTSNVHGTDGAGGRILPARLRDAAKRVSFQNAGSLHGSPPVSSCYYIQCKTSRSWQESSGAGCEKAKIYIWPTRSQDQLAVLSR